MNFLLLIKCLAGLAILLVVCAVLLISFVAFTYLKHYSKKKSIQQLKAPFQGKDFKELKPKKSFFFLTYAVLFMVVGIMYLIHPLLSLLPCFVWFGTGGHKTAALYNKPTKGKSLSSTRQRMEALRKKYEQPKLTKQERLKLRKLKHIQHRQNFLNRLAKRNR